MNGNMNGGKMNGTDANDKIKMPPNFRRIRGTKLYRSSRTDHLDDQSAKCLEEKYGINTVINMRGVSEMETHISSGQNKTGYAVDKYYHRYITTRGSDGQMKHTPVPESIELVPKKNDEVMYGSHHMIDVMEVVMKNNIKSCPLWMRIIVIIALFLDKFLKTSFVPGCLLSYLDQNMFDMYLDIIKIGHEAIFSGKYTISVVIIMIINVL